MNESYWKVVWGQFKKSKIAVAALCVLALFFIVGLYAPLFASSKPLVVYWRGNLYFPLLRYMFYSGFYTKPIDLFFNMLMLTFPLLLIGVWALQERARRLWILSVSLVHLGLFGWILSGAVKNPGYDGVLRQARQETKKEVKQFHDDPLLAELPQPHSWSFELAYLSTYGKLDQLLHYIQIHKQHQRLLPFATAFVEKKGRPMPTLWHVWERNEETKYTQLKQALDENEIRYRQARSQLPLLIERYRPFSHAFVMAKYALQHPQNDGVKKGSEEHLQQILNEASAAITPLSQARQLIVTYEKNLEELHYLEDKKEWLQNESSQVYILVPPILHFFHWEEDAGGAQEANQFLPWWELTRVNRKDLVASLLFGIRVSIVVGLTAVFLSLLIGIPLGTTAGYFAGKADLVICRMIEIWEAMPTFFMLLLVVAITQSKSIFLVIAVLGIFGWTGIGRFIRSEVLKQRQLSYVLACHSIGYTHRKIMFSHILPNAIPPILTLLPFSIMAAITSEAGLSFLGLGEAGSASWGVLMDEGRSAFPAESYLLWPPAILLTILLICIAIAGDAFRDAIDPKMR